MVRLSAEVQVDFRLSLNFLREGQMVARWSGEGQISTVF